MSTSSLSWGTTPFPEDVTGYWVAFSTECFKEQVLIRSMKSTGGITSGHGMAETQSSVWLMSLPANDENIRTQSLQDQREKTMILRRYSQSFNIIQFLMKKMEH
ncbi:hypothetical protein MAR_024634 [Mya arenaria]|uniref:Uncharacterized protein n=1 Tax=Mya arenaria TaxID=6604 RepID=A0ABY7DRC6_MYAAR|nr:hypothetical protein MAR_024634 [Mya arenaria]